MIYGLTMSVDGSMELFNINNAMVEHIIDDIHHYKEKAIIRKTKKDISIVKENEETIYYFNKEDRKQKVLQFIDVH